VRGATKTSWVLPLSRRRTGDLNDAKVLTVDTEYSELTHRTALEFPELRVISVADVNFRVSADGRYRRPTI
jgi:hypothetical protein